jgi:hypothetical protein
MEVYSDTSEWAQIISDIAWSSKIPRENNTDGYCQEDIHFGWTQWFFAPLGSACYSKLKQH